MLQELKGGNGGTQLLSWDYPVPTFTYPSVDCGSLGIRFFRVSSMHDLSISGTVAVEI